eukprot:11189982-Lingulodinium_polyedra.AAC.1
MMRSNRPPLPQRLANCTLARSMRTPVSGARMECERAICESLRRRTADSIATLRNVSQTLHNDAVEST